jgi:uncharacterized membrane protein
VTTPRWTDGIEPSSTARVAFRTLLGMALAFAGVSHLTTQREEFQAQVPACVPLSEDLVVVLSGVIEITLGLALIALLLPSLRRYRVVVGLVVAAFFIVIFPGNVGQWLEHQDAFGLDTDAARLRRLFFQPVLVAWALWSTGAWGPLVERFRAWRHRSAASDQ